MPEIRVVTVTLNPAVDRVLEAPGFAVGRHVKAKRIALYPAGKGVNVSRVLATLGTRSVVTGLVGKNELGMFEEHLERAGEGRIVCQLLIVRARTRDNTTIVDPVEDTETHVRDEGFHVQPDDVTRIGSKLGMLARPGVMMAFCGSLPPGLEPSAFAAIVRRCRDLGAKVVVDTSREALEALRGERLWMAKLNAAELETLAQRPTETLEQTIEASRALSVHGGGVVDHVVATLGADGAVHIGEGGDLRGWVSVHPGRIVSTVGCGDSLLAGMLSILARDAKAWERAMREGLAAATANACTREAGFFDPNDLYEFRDVATLEHVGKD